MTSGGSSPVPTKDLPGRAPGEGERIRPTAAQCQAMADFLQGLANPLRVEIVCSLRDGEQNVGEIARRVGGSRSNVSRQLQILMAKGYVVRRRQEQNVFYRVPPRVHGLMNEVLRFVCGP